jgi:hypothetical protein
MVIQKVGIIPGAIGGVWEGNQSIATACHFATFFWLYWDEFGELPTVDTIIRVGGATNVVNSMIPYGRALEKPAQGSVQFVPGSVLIFVENNQAGHSAIALDQRTIAGYNQENWFTTQGKNHNFSTHLNSDITWKNKNEIQRYLKTYKLLMVPEAMAKAVVLNLALTGKT